MLVSTFHAQVYDEESALRLDLIKAFLNDVNLYYSTNMDGYVEGDTKHAPAHLNTIDIIRITRRAPALLIK